jgi:hypothetical protein
VIGVLAVLLALTWITVLATRKPAPLRLVAVCALIGVACGAVWGFVRGLDHPPTVAFAVVEGAILFGVPGWLFGLLLAGTWWIGVSVRRRMAQ